MARKLIPLCVVATLSIVVLPAAADASPELRDEAGKVAVGATGTLTSTNVRTTNTKFGTMECSHYLYSGQVTANAGSLVALVGTGGQTTACGTDVGPLTVTNPTLKSLSTSGGDAGTMSLTFINDIGGFECHYEGTGTFAYATGTGNDTIHVVVASLNAADVCLAEDEETGEPIKPTFEGDFTLTTESTGEPIWIQ